MHVKCIQSEHLNSIDFAFTVHLEWAFKVQMKCFFFIPEFERAAKIRKIAVYRFLISFLVPEL